MIQAFTSRSLRFGLSMSLALLLAASFAPSALAEVGNKTNCSFVLNCQHESARFDLAFHSESGDCPEDDMSIRYTNPNSQLSQTLALPKDWYFFTSHISKTQKSLCKLSSSGAETTAYAVDKDHVMLFVKSSGRPGYDLVHVALLKSKTGELVDFKTLGQSKNQYIAVLRGKMGYDIRIIRDSKSFHQAVNCDCDAPFVDDWMQIYVRKGKLMTSWSNASLAPANNPSSSPKAH